MGNTSFTPFIITGENNSIIEDTYLLAALITFDPSITYNPRYDRITGRVSFEVHGKISDAMCSFYEGDVASLKAYIGHVKALRSAVFALKNAVKGKGPTTANGMDVR